MSSVTRVGDAAAVTAVDDGCGGSVSNVDFFSLVGVDGVWWIVSKIFVNTGGVFPGAAVEGATGRAHEKRPPPADRAPRGHWA